jgi:hypothetical protein
MPGATAQPSSNIYNADKAGSFRSNLESVYSGICFGPPTPARGGSIDLPSPAAAREGIGNWLGVLEAAV